VETGCHVIQEALVEAAGDTARLSDAQLRHLESCASCRALAETERRLDELLATVVPPADPTLEHSVMLGLRPIRLRRRLVALLPVAASLLVMLTGVALIGGLPGGSLLSLLPVWSSQGWLALIGAANDWVVALAATARAAQLTLPPLVPAAAVVATVIGSAAVVVATRRWRTLTPWRRHA
jgi:hypothetical protein